MNLVLVLFEVTIKKDFKGAYLAIADKLKENLANAKGFIRSERFSSLVNERKLLSLSVWKNEEAVNAWRNQHKHRDSQKQGRNSIFENYTITVSSLLRAYSDNKRQGAPEDSRVAFEN